MSVGGPTVVSVTRPTLIARPAEPELRDREPAQVEPAQVEPAHVELAQVELAQLQFAVIDLETTGWSPGAAAITEIAAVRVRGGRRQGEFASLVNPGVPVPPGIEDLTGITDWMLAAAPRLTASGVIWRS